MAVAWSLPDNLARIRKARNFSQEQLSAAASVSVDTIARIERAERQTTRPSTVDKLAAALGVTPAVLQGILPPNCATTAARSPTSPRRVTSPRTGCGTSHSARRPCAPWSTGRRVDAAPGSHHSQPTMAS
jgi:DNA-binding Xre family transcriptional regulator